MTDWTCADVENLSFKGTISDDKNSYFHFHILRCTEELLNMIPGFETATCASPREMAFFMATHILIGLNTNSYVESLDYEAPIKTIDDYLFYEQLDANVNTRRQVELNYNIAKFNDNLF